MRLCRVATGFLSLLAAFGLWAVADPPQQDKPAKPLTEKQRKRKEGELRRELATPYQRWLDQDVSPIITDEERGAFLRLQNDEEREQFIEQFWRRRNPDPDSDTNDFKEEYYRRIAYANDHFASGVPGWKTDRGRVYIARGAPDEIVDHSSGGFYERPPEEGGGNTSTFPFVTWRYRHLDGIGENIQLEFVDPTQSGEFHLTMDPSEKDALTYVPGAGLSTLESMGRASKNDRFNRSDGTHSAAAFGGLPESMDQFRRLEVISVIMRPPEVAMNDLPSVSTSIHYNTLNMLLRADYFPITDAVVQTNVTVQLNNRDLQFMMKDGYPKALAHIAGRVSTMTGRTVAKFEETVTVASPKEYLEEASARQSIYQKVLLLRPGKYRLNVSVADVTAHNHSDVAQPLQVPMQNPDQAATSSLVLADLVEDLPTKSIGTGPFVIGDRKVRPRMEGAFRRDEKMWLFVKLYHLAPGGTVQYEVVREGSGEKVIDYPEARAESGMGAASQTTIERRLALDGLQPGRYVARVKVTDGEGKRAETEAKFTVSSN